MQYLFATYIRKSNFDLLFLIIKDNLSKGGKEGKDKKEEER